VVFRHGIRKQEAGSRKGEKNFPELKPVMELAGGWDVQLDPKWFYPDDGTGGKLRFDRLADWTQRPEEAIKYYSGIALYRKVFDLPKPRNTKPVFLDLGAVKNVARVRLNGHDLGVVWTAPWRLEITGAVKEKGNELEVEVANLWPNRLIGDASLPKEKRRTVTNVRTYDTMNEERKKTGKPAEPLTSGLLGPVTLQMAQ